MSRWIGSLLTIVSVFNWMHGSTDCQTRSLHMACVLPCTFSSHIVWRTIERPAECNPKFRKPPIRSLPTSQSGPPAVWKTAIQRIFQVHFFLQLIVTQTYSNLFQSCRSALVDAASMLFSLRWGASRHCVTRARSPSPIRRHFGSDFGMQFYATHSGTLPVCRILPFDSF